MTTTETYRGRSILVTGGSSLRAIERIDTVLHSAALNHVESGEYNPCAATPTNVAVAALDKVTSAYKTA